MNVFENPVKGSPSGCHFSGACIPGEVPRSGNPGLSSGALAAVNAPKSTLLLRLMVGGVFFWEGVLKFVFANQGVGRFTKLGFPMPGLTAAGVGAWEIIGGWFLIGGWNTRISSLLFILEMIVAILSTKISIFLGTSPLALPPAPPQTGFWAVLHEIRSDYAQLMVSLFLFLEGPGPSSLDAFFKRKSKEG